MVKYKESKTVTYNKDYTYIEEICQYTYDSEEERIKHGIEMQNDGWSSTNQVKENFGTAFAPSYVWFGNYYKTSRRKK